MPKIITIHRKFFLYGLVALCGLALVALLYGQLVYLFSFESLRASSNEIADFVKNHYTLSLVLYVGLFVIDNVLVLPIAAVLTIIAGYFFGPTVGFFITLVASVCGAFTAFFLSRYFARTYVQHLYKKQLRHFNVLIEQYGTYFLLIVRLLPIIPFVLVNLCAGLTLISARTFFWTTAIGMIPTTLLFAVSGAEFHQIQSVSDIFSWKVIALFSLLICILLLPLIMRRKRFGF